MTNGITPQFDVLPAAKEAWSKVAGCKMPFFLALVIYVILQIVNQLIGVFAIDIAGETIAALFNIIIVLLVLIPFSVGMQYMGLQRVRGLTPIVQNVFYIFKKDLFLQVVSFFLIVTALFIVAGIVIGLLSFIPIINALGVIVVSLVGFYILTRMSLGVYYIFDKNEKVIAAIKRSIAVTNEHVWKMMLAYILVSIVMFLGVITLFVGLIWAVPFSYIYLGTIYQKIGS